MLVIEENNNVFASSLLGTTIQESGIRKRSDIYFHFFLIFILFYFYLSYF